MIYSILINIRSSFISISCRTTDSELNKCFAFSQEIPVFSNIHNLDALCLSIGLRQLLP